MYGTGRPYPQTWSTFPFCLQAFQDDADEAAQNLADIQARIDRLQEDMATSTRRLRSAATLTASLSDEAGRWTAAAAAQEASLATLPAAALLDAAALTYLGPLRGTARAALLQRWREAFRGGRADAAGGVERAGVACGCLGAAGVAPAGAPHVL